MDDGLEFPDENWSAWRVWCHPAYARDMIDEATICIMSLDKELKEAKAALQTQMAACEKLSGENDMLLVKLDEKDKEIAGIRGDLEDIKGKLDSALEELALCKSVDEQLAEVKAEIDKVETIKNRYEKRINYLEQLLQRERSSKSGVTVKDDEVQFDELEGNEYVPPPHRIDMTVGQEERNDLSENKKSLQRDKPGKKALELQRSYKEKRAFGLPENFPDSSDSDEWLMGLPEGL